jgi:hypothetical protein
MGRISGDEWHSLARREAAREFGKRHYGSYVVSQFAPHIALIVLAGAAGFGAWWLYSRIHAALSRPSVTTEVAQVHSGVPVWIWFTGALLAVGTVVVYRPGRVPSMPGVAIAKVAIVLVLWLAWVGFLLAQI